MKSIKITNGFLQELKKYSGFGWDFSEVLLSKDECFDEIVPEKLCHNNLLITHSIDKSILKYYGLGVFGYDYFLEKPENLNILDSFDIYNNKVDPFPFKVFGAYYNRGAFCEGISDVLNHKGKTNVDGNYDLNTLNDLKPCFELYAKGFKVGYEDFEDKFISPYLFKNSDKEDYLIKVFEYVTSGGDFRLNWTQRKCFISAISDYNIKGGAFDAGKYEGRFYRAWSIIFSQNILFAPLFQEYLIDNKSDAIDKLTIKQIALKYFYEKRVVTRENCNSEIVKFGHTSGEKLYQKFTYYSSRVNRKGIPSNCTAKKLQNKIKLIESVIRMLPDDCKKQAIDEVGILKIIAEEKNY